MANLRQTREELGRYFRGSRRRQRGGGGERSSDGRD